MKRLLALALIAGAAGCEPGPEEVPAEVAEARAAATRSACVTGEILRRAQVQYETLESSFTAAGAAGEAGSELTRRAAGAALEFGRVYYQHAQFRAASAAQIDSAMNHSPEDADSVRHIRAAEQYAIRVPEQETIEANVYQAYQQDLAELLANPDHPCNWELEPVDSTQRRGG